MLLNVSDDYFIRNIAGTCNKISTCPHVAASECAAQCLILYQQLVRDVLPLKLPETAVNGFYDRVPASN